MNEYRNITTSLTDNDVMRLIMCDNLFSTEVVLSGNKVLTAMTERAKEDLSVCEAADSVGGRAIADTDRFCEHCQVCRRNDVFHLPSSIFHIPSSNFLTPLTPLTPKNKLN
jgi:hypothetical protein